LDSSDIFVKPHSIDVELNSQNTYKLIADIKDYSGPFLKSKETINLESICETVEKLLPDAIDMEEVLTGYDSSDKESLLLKYLSEECNQ
jgi:hypothetical protein